MSPENVTLSGHWILSVIMIVVVGWIVFKYQTPMFFPKWTNVRAILR